MLEPLAPGQAHILWKLQVRLVLHCLQIVRPSFFTLIIAFVVSLRRILSSSFPFATGVLVCLRLDPAASMLLIHPQQLKPSSLVLLSVVITEVQ